MLFRWRYFNRICSCSIFLNINKCSIYSLVFVAASGAVLSQCQSTALETRVSISALLWAAVTLLPSPKPRAWGTQRSHSPLASKHCDNQYFPKTTSILSPCLQTKRQRFWGPGWLLILSGWKKKWQHVWPLWKCKCFSEIWFANGTQGRPALAFSLMQVQEALWSWLCWCKKSNWAEDEALPHGCKEQG